MAFVTPDSHVENRELDGDSLPDDVLSFSGWQVMAPHMGMGSLELPVGDRAPEQADLILATRTHRNVSGACAWARWSHLRLLWRPKRAVQRPP